MKEITIYCKKISSCKGPCRKVLRLLDENPEATVVCKPKRS